MNGRSLEDDLDLDIDMIGRARAPAKIDVSLQGQLAIWAGEMKQLIMDPTPVQVTYLSISMATFGTMFFLFIFVFSLGAVRMRGEVSLEEKLGILNNPAMQRMRLAK